MKCVKYKVTLKGCNNHWMQISSFSVPASAMVNSGARSLMSFGIVVEANELENIDPIYLGTHTHQGPCSSTISKTHTLQHILNHRYTRWQNNVGKIMCHFILYLINHGLWDITITSSSILVTVNKED